MDSNSFEELQKRQESKTGMKSLPIKVTTTLFQLCVEYLGQVSTQFPVLPSDEEVFTSLRHYFASSYILKVNSACFFVNIIQWHHASAT